MDTDESGEYEEPADGLSLEDHRLLGEVLDAMTPDDQSVIVPHFLHGYSSESLGSVLGLSVRTVNTRIANGIQRTRVRLGITRPMPKLPVGLIYTNGGNCVRMQFGRGKSHVSKTLPATPENVEALAQMYRNRPTKRGTA